jgi:GTP-binding protein
LDPVVNAAPPRRLVALVGRPNVGKSALFNRLLRRRLAIVHDEPGVTRDRISAPCRWKNEPPFELVDTGGIGLLGRAQADDEITAAVQRQIEAALEEAAVAILVVDIQAGVLPLDDDIARRLREHNLATVVAANKADRPELDDWATEFLQFGFPVVPVSAIQGRGIEQLMEHVLPRLPPPETSAESEVKPVRIAVVGRPNTGKSSYINRLLNRERVVVSPVPGTTRDAVEVPFTVHLGGRSRSYVLVDTAGVRASKRLESAVEFYSRCRMEHALDQADLAVLIFDATEGPTRQDKRIARMILDRHLGCIVVANKWDLATEGMSPQEARQHEQACRVAFQREVPFLSFAPLHFVSALTGRGVRVTVESFDMVAANLCANISTGLLNRVLHEAYERQPPPAIKGRRLKLFYAVQVGTRPPRFRLFVNDPELWTPTYEAYLMNRMRDAFSLEGAPILLEPVERPREPSAARSRERS